MPSPFEILQVDPDADEAEIEQAYRRRVMETHPDRGGSAEAFKRVQEAHEAIEEGHSLEPLEYGPRRPGARRTESETRTTVEYLNYEVVDDYGWALDDEDLFEKASGVGLDHEDYGRFLVQPGESLLEAAENRGFAWPFACRGGACANCAVAILEGELSMPVDHIMPTEMLDEGLRLSCNGMPVTEEMRVVYNVKHLPCLEELRLPPRPFEQAHLD